jgi:predicted MFS family arabinose efflux permease
LLFGITFFVTASSSLVQGEVRTSRGMVRTVVRAGLIGLLLLVIPLSPFYWLAAVAYVARSGVKRGSMGPRSALLPAAVPDRRRATALSISSGAMQVSGAAGLTFVGALFDGGQLEVPFCLSLALQAGYIVLFHLFFAHYAWPSRTGPRPDW